ncbi:proline-rich transmembrane protein 4 [Alosa sapidissima]|uniref:proline-rich transmembrane protein 4 n=1 Tax=Alosa sapidissima TaxID=34773 RepID=UPI001C09E086|nr:proline-rich transmembrane protein 4 [Alosa sapidissima]
MLLFHLTLLLCISCSLPGPLHGWSFYRDSDQITAPPQKNSDKKGTSFWNPLETVRNSIAAVKPASLLPFNPWDLVNTRKAPNPEVSTNDTSTPSPSQGTPHVPWPWHTGTVTPIPPKAEPNSFPDNYNGTYKLSDTSHFNDGPISTSTAPGPKERSDWTDSPSYQPIQTTSLQKTPYSIPAQGTMSYLTGTKSPSTLLRTRQPTVKKKPALDPRPDISFDLDLWPPSNTSQKEVLQRTSETHHQENWTFTQLTSNGETTDKSMTHGHQSYPTPNYQSESSSSIQPDLPTPSVQTMPRTMPVITSSPTTQVKGIKQVTQPAVNLPQHPEDPRVSEEGGQQSQREHSGGTQPKRVGDKQERMGVIPESTTAAWLVATRPQETKRSDMIVTTKPTQTDGPGKVLWSPGIIPQLQNDEVTPSSTEDWGTGPAPTDMSLLPDCNMERSGICNTTDNWPPIFPSHKDPANTTTFVYNQSSNSLLVPASPMFVALHSDWNSAMATWGLAWEAHIYGLGGVFSLVTLASALNLLCLPLRCPSGCGYFALVSIFLLAAGSTRAFALLYDAYGHQGRLGSAEASLWLYEAPFPCLTAAFGLVFLLLSMRSRMQLSYSAFQRPCFLACLVLLHFTAAFGPMTLLGTDQQGAPLCLFLSLVSRGAFVVLASFLSAAYFVFYCYVRADSKHIYHLNNTSPTPAERYNRCPFAESREWELSAAAVLLSAALSLACAGLQLYAMLHALGFAGGPEVFKPWPWWSFQLSCRICEAGVCLALALVVAQPVYCSDHLPQPGNCWTELLAAKSPILPGTYHWTLNQQEKLAICDTIGHGETECLPLYSLVDERLGNSLNGLDLLYHSNRALAYRDFDLDQPDAIPDTRESSCASDSTTDLRPPSPINLRRSIDEALFSEDLFPMSLFSPLRPFSFCDQSLDPRGTLIAQSSCTLPLRESLPSDPGLFRTASCVEILPQASLPSREPKEASGVSLPPPPSLSPATSSCCSSPEGWRGSSSTSSLCRPSLADSSLVLCSSPEPNPRPSSLSGSSGRMLPSDHQRQYRNLDLVSQESLDQRSELDQTVQEEFKSVCRQIDALSICSETIDL